MKKSVPYIIDCILSLLIFLCFNFVFFAIFTKGINLVCVSIIFSFTLDYFYMKLLNNYDPKIKNIQDYFYAMSNGECYTYFAKVLRTRYKVIRYKNYLLINNICVFIHIKQQNLSLDRVYKFLQFSNKIKSSKTLILASNIDNDVKNCIDFKNLTIYDINAVYNLLVRFNGLPNKQKKKHNIPEIISLILSMDNAKRFLSSGIILFIFSGITRYSIFYLIFSIICFSLWFCCIIKSKLFHKYSYKTK